MGMQKGQWEETCCLFGFSQVWAETGCRACSIQGYGTEGQKRDPFLYKMHMFSRKWRKMGYPAPASPHSVPVSPADKLCVCQNARLMLVGLRRVSNVCVRPSVHPFEAIEFPCFPAGTEFPAHCPERDIRPVMAASQRLLRLRLPANHSMPHPRSQRVPPASALVLTHIPVLVLSIRLFLRSRVCVLGLSAPL